MAARRTGPTPDTITDPVEWTKHYWQELALDGDAQHFVAMTSLLRYQHMVVVAVDAELKRFELGLTDYLVLMTLQLSEAGTRLISSLARNLMIHATTATLAIDRLETKKLLARSPHPTDRRATCVTISARGRTAARSATAALDLIDFGLTDSTPTSVKTLLDVLGTLRSAAGDSSTRLSS